MNRRYHEQSLDNDRDEKWMKLFEYFYQNDYYGDYNRGENYDMIKFHMIDYETRRLFFAFIYFYGVLSAINAFREDLAILQRYEDLRIDECLDSCLILVAFAKSGTANEASDDQLNFHDCSNCNKQNVTIVVQDVNQHIIVIINVNLIIVI